MRKFIITGMAVAMLAVPASAMATPTTGPEAGPGCFGKWRAGSVQALQNQEIPGFTQYENAGQLLSERAQSEIGMKGNVAIDKSYCAA